MTKEHQKQALNATVSLSPPYSATMLCALTNTD